MQDWNERNERNETDGTNVGSTETELFRRLSAGNLGLGELFEESFQILKRNLKSYLMLLLMVHLPVQMAMQFEMLKLDFAVEDETLLLNQFMTLAVTSLLLSLLELVSILVIAVIVQKEILGQAGENAKFTTMFYRGIRMWPRAVLTYMLLMLGTVLCMLSVSGLLLMPIAQYFAIAGLVLLAVLLQLYQSCTATVAALRGRMGFDNLRYVYFVFEGRMWRAMGIFALIMLMTQGLTQGCSTLLSLLLSQVGNTALRYVLTVLCGTALSLIALYGFTAGALLFLNAEAKKAKELKSKS